MPDPSNPISFPSIDGILGFTCGVYSFGWTSGCTDENNLNRGFTQEWYYDGEIGAWVSVTEGFSGGGADFTNAGATYDSVLHTAPEISGSGNIRKFAYLEPDTGALTFDYVYTYDLVNPNETVYRAYDLSWQSIDDFEYRLPNGSRQQNEQGRNLPLGVTLCATAGYTYAWSNPTDSDLAFRWYINCRADAENGITQPSPFATPPSNTFNDFIISADLSNATLVNIGGSSDDNLPLSCGDTAYAQYYSGNTGQINVYINKFNIGFTTASGPQYNVFRPKVIYSTVPGDENTSGLLTQNNMVSTENFIYMFAHTGATGPTGGNLDDYVTGVLGSSGERFMLDPGLATNKADHKIYHRVSQSTLGPVFNYYVYFAAPTRCNVVAGHLQQNANINQAAGFSDSTQQQADGSWYHLIIQHTNENGYTESYDLFRSINNNGSGSEGSRISKSS